MKEKLLHTPAGVRDIYNAQCKKKAALERKLHGVLASYGYQDIETPTFEYFDIFNSDTGTVDAKEMFKFFDRDNNTLVLRPDMTPSIARSAAKYYSDCTFPLRLSYVGNTFLNNPSYQGKLAEKTELGAEYINDDSPEADAEAVIMMIDCFLSAGLSDFRVDIGESNFYNGLMDELDVTEDVKAQIHEYIENKNSFGMELFLDGLKAGESASGIQESGRRILSVYNDLYGDAQMLSRAKKLTDNPRCLLAIRRLEEVYDVICQYGYENYIHFDLGIVNHLEYYTGIIFRGYPYGTGDAIGKGGRYDTLLSRFGKEAPAIGFTILIDDMLAALNRQSIPVSVADFNYSVLLYRREDRREAIDFGTDLRRSGERLALICMDEGKTEEEYLNFVKTQGAQQVFILKGEQLTLHDFENARVAKTNLSSFRKEY